ncbi:hypothetical protein SAMN05660489_02369 [Pseudomonas sp. LAMO17WK12:I10]|nr:hypothetical protein H160_02454 [Pseudomonas sp. LAMO17WK12:I9]SNY28525.1 hypothetical protein SAMN05660489_02369 [Pseudomonas sp. LAMO17WK12:I10]
MNDNAQDQTTRMASTWYNVETQAPRSRKVAKYTTLSAQHRAPEAP